MIRKLRKAASFYCGTTWVSYTYVIRILILTNFTIFFANFEPTPRTVPQYKAYIDKPQLELISIQYIIAPQPVEIGFNDI